MRAAIRCARALGHRPTRPLNGLSLAQGALRTAHRTTPPFARAFFAQSPPDETSKYRVENTSDLHIWAGEELGHVQVPAAILRDACPQSRSPSSGNKSFATSEIPLDIKIKSLDRRPDGNLEVTWENDIPRFAELNHVSVFTPEQLQTLQYDGNQYLMHAKSKVRPGGWPMPLLWDVATLENRGVKRISYEDWMAGGDAFYEAVAEIELMGLVFVVGVPKTKEAVADLGLKFGALQETFYGRTWDVISKPQAENVAYTSEYLGLHSDMLYLKSPPKLQLLHCLENDAEGGGSLFCDGRRIGHEMTQFHLKHVQSLNRNQMVFHYNANGHYYTQKRKIFAFSNPSNGAPIFQHLWWSPPFQGSFGRPANEGKAQAFKAWHRGAVTLQSLIDDPANVYRHRLQAGECAVFDNHRVLHGREAFDPSTGARHLHGTYVHIDEWRSVMHRVPEKYTNAIHGVHDQGPRTGLELRNELIKSRHAHDRTNKEVRPETLKYMEAGEQREQRHRLLIAQNVVENAKA